MLACRAALRPAIENSISGAKLYVGRIPDNVTPMPPYAQIRRGNEVPQTVPSPGVGLSNARYIDIVYLDLYARGPEQAQIMENAVSFMDNYIFPDYGNAQTPWFRMVSKTEQPETGSEHITVMYEVRYADKRRLPS